MTRIKAAGPVFLFIASHQSLQIGESIMTTVGIHIPVRKVATTPTELRLGSLTALVIG
ncbi:MULTISPECIES: hypothetical protein [unclassified Mesorhizobium]|uniref:hypothetical protein n=1 Tax=unclassified Mesorhizobium TaxID=325217 RepID=UPI000AF59B59|nr:MULTISPECIES: hypothetical protein [unclassified Mesorhizobium]